jgi:hypothetical protein
MSNIHNFVTEKFDVDFQCFFMKTISMRSLFDTCSSCAYICLFCTVVDLCYVVVSLRGALDKTRQDTNQPPYNYIILVLIFPLIKNFFFHGHV